MEELFNERDRRKIDRDFLFSFDDIDENLKLWICFDTDKHDYFYELMFGIELIRRFRKMDDAEFFVEGMRYHKQCTNGKITPRVIQVNHIVEVEEREINNPKLESEYLKTKIQLEKTKKLAKKLATGIVKEKGISLQDNMIDILINRVDEI